MAKDALGFEIVEEEAPETLTPPAKKAKVDSLGFEVVDESRPDDVPPSAAPPTLTPSPSPKQTKLSPQDEAAGAQLTDEGQVKNRGFIRKDELQEIATRYKVDPDRLSALVPFYNLSVEGETSPIAERITGFVSESIAGPSLMWVYKKVQDEPNFRLALDDLRELADRQKTKTQMGVETAAGLLTGIGAVSKAGQAGKLAQATTAAAQGTMYGVGGSREGEELKGAAIGAAGGVVLHGALQAVGKGASAVWNKTEPAIKNLLENTQRKFADDVEDTIQPTIERRMMDEAPINEAKTFVNTSREGHATLLDIKEFQAYPETGILREVQQELPPLSRAGERELIFEMQEAGLKETDDAARKTFMAFRKQQEEFKEFAQYVSGRDVKPQLEDALGIIEHKLATEGQEKVTKLSNDFISIKTAERVLAEEADRGLVRDPIRSGFFSNMANKIFDGSSFVSRRIDKHLGTKFEPLLDRAAVAQNRFSLISVAKNKLADNLDKAISKGNINREAIYDVLNGTRSIDSVDMGTAQVVNSLRAGFKESLEDAQKLGIPISKIENYVPQAMVDLPEALIRMDKMAGTLKKEVGLDVLKGLEKEEYEALIKASRDNNSTQQYLKALSNLTGEPTNNVFQFNKAVKLLSQPAEIGRKWGTIATAAQKREGEIPRFLRETDPVYLYRKWNHNTFRHAFFRDSIDEGKRIAQLAAKAGDRDSANFMTTWVETMSGGKPTWSLAKNLADMKIRWEVSLKRKAAQEGVPKYKQQALNFVAETPDFFSTLLRNLHPNLLGFSLKAILPNLVQPIVMGIPELGVKYGGVRIAKAYARVLKGMASGNASEMVAKLKAEGLTGGKWTGENVKALQDGIKSSKVLSTLEKGSEKLNAVAMFFYEKTEVLNTLVAKELGADVSKDIIKALEGQGNALSKESLKFVEKMGAGYRRAMDQAISQGDTEKIQQLTTDYVKSKVNFNYTRASLSEFGRVCGPLFSVFLKWPTTIAGDMITHFLERGAVGGTIENARKYLGPLALLYGLNQLLPGQDESDLQKATIGTGLTRLAAAGNVESILKGDILQPPMIGLATDSVSALHAYTKGIEEGNEAMVKAAGNMFQLVVPGASLIRFLTQDIPGMTGQGLPREGSFFDKTQEGIENLTK